MLIPWVISEALARHEAQVFAELGAIGIPHWQHKTCTNLFIEISTVASADAWGPSIVQKFRVGCSFFENRESMPSPFFPLLWNNMRVVQEIQKANSTDCLHRKPGRKFIGINEKKDKKSASGRLVLSYFLDGVGTRRAFVLRTFRLRIECTYGTT